MPIKITQHLPASGLESVLANVYRTGGEAPPTHEPAVAAMADAGKAGRHGVITRPYPIYDATLQSVLDRKPLDKPELAAWQYLVIGEDESVQGLAEIIPTEDGKGFAWNALYSAESAQALVNAIHDAEQDARTQRGTYELRVLRIPDVYLQAVWLQGDRESFLLPIDPVPSLLRRKGLMSDQQLADALKPLALRRRDRNDSERPPASDFASEVTSSEIPLPTPLKP